MNRLLSTKTFILTHMLILLIGLSFLAGLYYILNVQYQPLKNFSSGLPITSKPTTLNLEISQPDDDLLTYTSSLYIAGKTTPYKDILISSEDDDLIIKSQKNGTFSTVINLNEGVNKLKIVVFDETGLQREVTKTIYYSKEKI